jgi:hypothetical protein
MPDHPHALVSRNLKPGRELRPQAVVLAFKHSFSTKTWDTKNHLRLHARLVCSFLGYISSIVAFFLHNVVIWGLCGGRATTQPSISYDGPLDATLCEMHPLLN